LGQQGWVVARLLDTGHANLHVSEGFILARNAFFVLRLARRC
jgi:hypothetical protein